MKPSRPATAGPAGGEAAVPNLMEPRRRAGWNWRIGVLVLVGLLGLPTIGLIGTVHIVRQTAERTARDSNAVVASAVATEVGQSFAQRVAVLETLPSHPAVTEGLASADRDLLQAEVDGALADGQYCRLVLFAPGIAPVSASGPGACWSPPGAAPTGPGVQVVGPGIVGTLGFTSLDLAVPGHPGAFLRAVVPVSSLTRFGIPGAGSHTTVLAGLTIVSSTTPALVGKQTQSAGSRAMIRRGQPATATLYGTLIHARVILAYRPVPGTGLGVFYSVSTAVAYAPATHLTHVLLAGYLVLLGIIAALAGLVLVMFRRRDRATDAAAQQYRTLAEATPDGVAIIDADGRLLYANPALVAMLALGPPDTWIGHPVSEWNDFTVDEWLATRAPAIDGGQPIPDIKMRLRRSDGHHFTAEANVGPFDLDGQPGLISVIRDLTESRAAEAAVATIIETVAEGIVFYDLNRTTGPRPVRMNPAAVEMLGYTLPELQSLWTSPTTGGLVDSDGRPAGRDEQPVAVVARTGEAVADVVCGIPDRDGNFRWIRTSANPMRDDNGVMIGIVSSLVDVTPERSAARMSERALRESEERFRSAFEDAPIAKALIGLQGRYEQVNQAMCNLTGYRADQLLHLSVAATTFPEDLPQDMAAMNRLLAGDTTPYTLEKRYRTASGGLVWVSKSASLIRSDDGTPRHFIAQIQDITQRREHEQALADERRRLLEAQSLGHVGSWEMDLVTGVVSWSDSFLELHGIDPDERWNDPPPEPQKQIHPDDGDRILSAYNSCIRTGEPMRARYRVVRRNDDALRWFDVAVARQQDGLHRRVLGAVVDVTEIVLAAHLAEESRDMALEASRQKSAFLATMSHEIRTPMNAVIGMTGLLLDTALDVDQREFVETVRSSGDTLLGIINDILDFSKIEAGGLVLEQRPFDLRDCVEEALDLVAATSKAKGLELVGLVDDVLPGQVVGDVTRLRQVLVNLLGNAVKFTAEGEVVLRVEPVGDGTDAEVALRVSVTDTGIGIPADRLASLFDSFSQVDTSTTRVYGGTGLGLAISQRLVEAMGGRLSVESSPGVGSTFAFSIALGRHHLAGEPPPEAPAPALAGHAVLIVDDNPTNRRILHLQLERWGLAVTEAGSGREATALFDSGAAFDVAVLDMQMPEMTGHELAVALRAAPSTAALPLILLSSAEGRLALHRPEMFSAILTKPVRMRRLEAGLRHALRSDGAPLPEVNVVRPAPPVRHDPMRVLLAEDNLVNQRLGRLMLEKLGEHVDVVGNGEEAVAAVRLVPYDAVLMDVQMPVLDGLEATRRIRRELAAGRQPHIIAMTASALVEDRQACYDAGMDDYLAKPVRLAELDNALKGAAAHAAQRAQLPHPLEADTLAGG